ncbi:MAG: transcriptional regulator [Micrococcales bacterium 70-64]|nr:MarR family transcriptional regulator [Leifsonia sp.]ODU63766.1 MAG: transcriptional regulator [Leifsonia sp. SCN 70-46]OJX85457.1 MAG: transcriptional regulator [Micrococcales bacterium 70-64]
MSTPRPIGFWLKLVDRLIDEQFASTLDEHGVTRRQWQLLNVLTHEPATEEALDAAVAPFLVEQESSREHLAELLDSGWVTLDASTYAITERGRGALERLSAVVATQRTLTTEGLTQEQYDETLRVLEVMARNLGWRE